MTDDMTPVDPQDCCGLWQLVDGADACSDTCPRATTTRLPKELTS